MRKKVYYSKGRRIETSIPIPIVENKIIDHVPKLSETEEFVIERVTDGIVKFIETQGSNVILYVILKFLGL